MITKADGTEEVREGNPLERLKEYYSEFHIEKKTKSCPSPVDWLEILDMIS